MIDKILTKLSLKKVRSRRFVVFVVGTVLIFLGKIDAYSFILLSAVYIGCGTVEKILAMRNGKN